MSAICRCWCGCERRDPDLDDATSSWLVCMSCCLDRHKRGWWECPTCGGMYSEKPEQAHRLSVGARSGDAKKGHGAAWQRMSLTADVA